MEKGTLDDIIYAVRELDKNNSIRDAAIVGNGVVFWWPYGITNLEDVLKTDKMVWILIRRRNISITWYTWKIMLRIF